MKILSIETSCDETAIAVVDVSGQKQPKFKLISEALFSQAKIHEEFGGVFPNVARREHQKNLVPLFLKATKSLNQKSKIKTQKIDLKLKSKIEKILEREPELLKHFEKHIFSLPKPKIDKLAVTSGPGLEPALWVGINFAKALSTLWDIPLIPVNHMKGHFLAPLAEGEKIKFPALGLLISGGHTELVLAKNETSYKIIGQTLDDACGEAYDKAARILGLPYPGGPEIAKLAKFAREKSITHHLPPTTSYVLPRPMINSKDLNFSFSGLKTAVLYMVQKIEHLDETKKILIAKEFEESVKDVLVKKTTDALKKHKVKTLVVGGGVSANSYIAKNLEKSAKELGVPAIISSKKLATDNAIMIAVAAFFSKKTPLSKIKAEGTLSL